MRFDAHTHFVTRRGRDRRARLPDPGCGRDWLPTLPPVVLDEWPVASELERRAHHDGRALAQLRLDPPRRRPLRPEGPLAAPADRPPAPRRRCRSSSRSAIHPDETSDLAALRENGWTLLDPGGGRRDARRLPPLRPGLVGRVRAREVGLRRLRTRAGSATAAPATWPRGGPVIAQDTGFGRRLPDGRGAARLLHRRRRGRGGARSWSATTSATARRPARSPSSTSTPTACSASLLERLLP